MKKAIVIGCPGSGKTTFSEKLNKCTGLPLFYLDAIWHKPDRTHISREEFDSIMPGILKKDKWIIDGNYSRTIESRIKACDTVFLFDLPTEICLQGATERLGKSRYDVPWIDTELDPVFKKEIEDFKEKSLPYIYDLLNKYRNEKNIIIFKSRQQSDKFLNRVINMGKNLIEKIDSMIEEVTDSLIADTMALININSEQSAPKPGAPFGEGPRMVLDKVLEMGKNNGFCTTDYGVGVVSVSFKDTQPDLGIWAHGDVVSAGEGWTYPPYNATLYKNCIIGRGATDNKGQLCAIFNLFKIFKELGIKLKYNPALYVGSNEENGMKDMVGIEGNPDAKGFINVCTMPRLSLVPDSGFPVAHGARGLTTFKFKSKTPLHGFSISAGQDDNPGLATAVFNSTNVPDALPGCTVTKTNNATITAFTPPRHTALPDPDGNMITVLTSALLDAGLVPKEDEYILKFFKEVSTDVCGKMLGIYAESKLMKPTTVFAKSIDFCNGYCELTIKVRYPVELTYDELKSRLEIISDTRGFDLWCDRGHMPYINDNNMEFVQMLADIANSVTGDSAAPFIAGATYAHYLPNAYVYGMNGCLPPEGYPTGHGGAHGVDECVSVERLKRAMRIYARTLLKLNETKW